MKPDILALIAISLAAVLSSCGGGGDTQPSPRALATPSPSVIDELSPTPLDQSGVRVVLEADVSQLPPGTDIDDAMREVVEILERRAEAFGAAIAVEAESSNRVSVSLEDVNVEEARELLGKTAHLEFRKPTIDEFRDIVCETEDGSEFAVPSQQVSTATVDDRRVSQCLGSEGETGEVVWEPATGTDSQGVERALTGAFLRPNAKVVGPPPTVAIEFTGDGALLFEQVTAEVVGLPLAIFLDEELVAAPTVQQPITGGNATITGLSEDEARTLAIQLNAGALPAPLRVISIEETP